jgi:hypothetical protein
MYAPLPVTAIPLLLRLVVPHVEPGTEDLLPSLFGLSIARLWNAVLNKETNDDTLVDGIRITFAHFR